MENNIPIENKIFNIDEFNLDSYKNLGIPTGINIIDKLTEGGLDRGKIYMFNTRYGGLIDLRWK